jgi:hypothetical protein
LNDRPTALERAFELAGSGRFAELGHVRAELKREGYELSQLTGPQLKQLRGIMDPAQRAKVPADGQPRPCLR